MLKILQARLQQYINQTLPGVQAGLRRGQGTRDQIANICQIIEKAREFQKNLCFTDYTETFDHGKMDWFQIGKVVHQGCILSPCLFN